MFHLIQYRLENEMIARYFLVAVTFLGSIACATAGEPVDVRTKAAQAAAKTRAKIIAETKLAIANGEVKFGPLVDFEELVAQRAPQNKGLAQDKPAVTNGKVSKR
jgi:hypothetical protein